MKRVNLVILVIFCCSAAYGQESYLYFNWDVNTPLANTEWLDNTSARGARLGFRKFIGVERKFSAGVDFNWAFFDEYKPTETFPQPGGAITTDYFNEIDQLGLTVSGQYYFPVGNREHIFPYTGLGLGVNHHDYIVLYNIYSEKDSSWGFLARPEAGVLIRIGTRRKLGAMAAIHYDYSTAKSSNYNYNNFSSVGFQLGIMLMQW